MERLRLIRQGGSLGAFSQYLPGNMQATASRVGSLTVGAVFDNMACGAALAERSGSSFYLRYVYIDPQARLCGLGTHLLRGMLGEAKKEGAAWVKAIFSMDMLEESRLSGCFARAGFSKPEAISTSFTAGLEDISLPPGNARGFETLPLSQLSPALYARYLSECDRGELPPYVDIWEAKSALSAECSLACLKGGELAAVMVVQERPEGLFLQGMYVVERFRGAGAASVLIRAGLEAAKRVYPEQTPITTSTIGVGAMDICYKLFNPARMQKQTEYRMIYKFQEGQAV